MTPRFRKKSWVAALSRDEQERQGRIVRSASAAFASTEAVLAFLNTHHDGLRGRPLDLAMASDEGLLAVEAAIGAERRPPAGVRDPHAGKETRHG